MSKKQTINWSYNDKCKLTNTKPVKEDNKILKDILYKLGINLWENEQCDRIC